MKLSFHGATEEVTGSCFLLEVKDQKILIDCGMKQGERVCMLRTMDEFTFDPKSLTAVVVTHAHFDHTGRLPELIAKGYKGPIYMTPPTKSLTDIILEDSLHIMAENAERCGDPVPYGKEDKDACMKQIQGVAYHTEIALSPAVHVVFHDAGHILGSSFITIDVAQDNGSESKRFLFSGDIGNDDVPILPPTDTFSRADYVICEATYGDREHESAAAREEGLREFAKKILNRGGTLLIPAFSVERTQEILYELDKLVHQKDIPEVPVYLDSPLAIRATELYRHFSSYLRFDHPAFGPDKDFFSFPRLKETMRREDSQAINEDHGSKIIIAGNGMMTGGRILHHLLRYLPDERAGLLVVGFQAPGTLGRRISNGEKKIRIFRQEVEAKLEVGSIHAFSAHGDRRKLARFLKPETGEVKKIFLVHGEDEGKQRFAEYLKETHATTAEIVIPRLHEVFEL